MSRASFADPAFPNYPDHYTRKGGQNGMSMRQWYTGQALKGLLSNPSITARFEGNNGLPVPKDVATLALEVSQEVMDQEKNQ
jgi:hypothetical protein